MPLYEITDHAAVSNETLLLALALLAVALGVILILPRKHDSRPPRP